MDPYAVALALLVMGLFAPATRFEFINFVDPEHFAAVPEAGTGLSLPGLGWALRAPRTGFWLPVTRLSHLVDFEVYGGRAGGHHATNVALHGANAGLLLLFLHRATGALWPSAAAAALFAIHPLRVESVAWVTERKDVLSGFLTLLTLLAYARYVRSPTRSRFAWCALPYALALMAKPMAVTVPLLLLLFDYWPLGRLRSRADLWPLVREKTVLFLAAGACSALTLLLNRGYKAALPPTDRPLAARLATALVACATYVVQTVWPHDLAVFYPYPAAGWSAAALAGALAIVGACTVMAIRGRASRPHVFVGWFAFVLGILPVSGVVQSGAQTMADRFTYLPSIGLAIAVAWSAWRLAQRGGAAAVLVNVTASMVGVVLAIATWRQLPYWRNSETLFRHALAVTRENWLAHNNLGDAMLRQGRIAEASTEFGAALRIVPRYADAHYNLGVALALQGRLDEAIGHFRAAVEDDPTNAPAYYNLGLALYEVHRPQEAADAYRRALALAPRKSEAHYGLALALSEQGDHGTARRHFDEARRLDPRLPAPP